MPENLVDSPVIEPPAEMQPSLEILPRADIITGKQVNPAETAEQRVLGRPAPNPPQLTQSCYCILVIELRQRCQINLSRGHGTSQLNERTGLIQTVPECSENGWLDLTEVFRARKRMTCALKVRAKPIRQAIEQYDPDSQAQLLAGDAVHKRFEQRGKASRFQTTVLQDKPVQSTIALGESIKFIETDRKPKQPVKRCLRRWLDRRSKPLTSDGDVQSRANLPDAHQHRPLFNHQDPLICCSVPVIHGVTGAAAQGPDGQIETERRHRPDREVSLFHGGCVRWHQ